MDKALATKVIDTARFYMSGDNCQPFRYRFNLTTQIFHIDYFADEAKHTFVYDDYTILLTLGSLLEYLDVTLQHYSYICSLEFDFKDFLSNKDKANICSVSIKKNIGKITNSNLFDTLKQRFTDRRPYKSHESINIEINELNKNLSFSNCKLFINADAEILDFFADCDSSIWLSKALGIDIMNAVAFNSKSPTGLPWRNLGVKKSEALLIKAIQRYHWLFDALKTFGAKTLMLNTQKKLWFSSRSFMVFSYSSNLSKEQQTIASKQMMYVLLDLSKRGYVFQPSTMSAEILNLTQKSNNIVTASKMKISNFEELIQRFRTYLGVSEDIQWILRIGKVETPLDRDALTNRHSSEELLNFE